MADELDYRLLLKRYMDNVAWNEGVYFLPTVGHKYGFDVPWAEDEVAALEEIAAEIDAEQPNTHLKLG